MSKDLINPAEEYNTISGIVDYYLNSSDLSQHYYAKVLGWAIWGLRELKLDQAQEVKTDRFTVSDVQTVTLPVGFVDWCKIAIPVGQYLKTLAVNGDLSREERIPGRPEISRDFPVDYLPNGIDFGEYIGYAFANYNGNSLMSVGGGVPAQGLFQVVDRGNGSHEIVFDKPMTASEVVVEWISDGINPCGETVVNSYLADYVLKYIIYSRELFRPFRERNESAIYRADSDVKIAIKKVRARRNNLDPKTMVATSRRYLRLTTKA